ncbi:MAG: Holliday junction resolvase-like protein [Gemmatimonadota bacterium]
MNYDVVTIIALAIAAMFAILYFTARANVESKARHLYERWRIDNESLIRQDAIDRSRSVTIGKVTEHMAPWLPRFPYNPKDARFIGSPIDMIVFDGCDDEDMRRIIFLEIKTSTSGLTTRQRQIRDAVLAGKVEWRELRVPTHAKVNHGDA